MTSCESVSQETDCKRRMLESGVVQIVVDSLKQFPDNEAVHVEALKFLKDVIIAEGFAWVFSYNDFLDPQLTTQCKEAILNSGAIEVVLNCIQNFASNPSVLSKCFQAIINFTHSNCAPSHLLFAFSNMLQMKVKCELAKKEQILFCLL